MLTPQAISDFKNFIDNTIAYAKVTVNGVTEKKAITRRERLKNDRVVRTAGRDESLIFMMCAMDCYVVLRLFSIVCLRL